MSLIAWFPLNKDTNLLPGLASFRVEGGVTLTADSDGWYKVQDSTHGSGGNWGIYYDMNVKPNTTYTLVVYSKSTTGIPARTRIGSYEGVASWPGVANDNTGDEKKVIYSFKTGGTHNVARLYLCMTCSGTKANDYVFFKAPTLREVVNQGLSDIGMKNNDVAYDSIGKIGGSYYFNASSYITENTYDWTNFNPTAFSLACWYKEPSPVASGNSQMICIGTSSGWNNIRIGLLRRTSNGYPMFSVSDGTNNVNYNFTADSFPLDTWNHIVCTYNNGTMKMYLNGILHKTYTTTITPVLNSSQHLGIGAASNGSEPLTGYLNDVRIYDHCLSAMEVKLLSQGLILHYPLNRGGWGQENLFNWSNNATGITLYDYQNVGSFTQFTNSLSFDPSTTVGKKYTISFWARSPNGTTSLSLYNSNGKPKYFNFSTTLTSNLGTEWQFFKYTVTNTQYTGSDASTNTNIWKRIEIYAPSKMKVQVKQIKVEEGSIATPWCPNSSDALATAMGLNGTTEYDCSGFCNNGTKNGTFSYTSNTPKYAVSTNFSGTETIATATTGADILTLSCWVKTSKSSSTSQMMVADSASKLCCSFYQGNYISFYGENSGYSTGSRCLLGSEYKENEWNHFVSVKTGEGTRDCYCNGVKLTPTTNDWWSTATGFWIGNRNTGGNLPFYGQICDVRAYATALSADDVKALYKNSAYIDNAGNVYGVINEV